MRWAAYHCYRPTIKVVFVCVFTFVLTSYLFWNGCDVHDTTKAKLTVLKSHVPTAIDCEKFISKAGQKATEVEGGVTVKSESCPPKAQYMRLEVHVNNGDKKIEGRLDTNTNEAYVPFSFIKEYFEIYGEVREQDEKKILDWRHSTSEIRLAKEGSVYRPEGPFLWFQYYRVEGRTRVKCVSGVENVPVSIQWSPDGYFYPIQIAQYGLSHYSLLQLEGKSNGNVKVFEDGESPSEENWLFSAEKIQLRNVFDEERASSVITFSSRDLHGDGAVLNMDSATRDYILSFDLKLAGDVHITVIIESDNRDMYSIHYVTDNSMVSVSKMGIVYGIGRWNGWRRITRDLDTDLRKGLRLLDKNAKKIKLTVTEIQSVILKGKGSIDNIQLSHTAHADFFMAAADWFIRNQDNKGGWPIMVKRKIIPGVELKPGWYSAMAQGHGISLLVRAFYYTKNSTYYTAALKATKPFRMKSENNGVLATFMGKYVWYEEYPSSPSLFVLNGFIYSLIGLYDLMLMSPTAQRTEAETLFTDGMRSLKAMLLMYDTGSGTFYDLRHITMLEAPNLARWDYHTLHVSLLHFLSTVDSNSIFKETAERWTGYTKGKRVKHN